VISYQWLGRPVIGVRVVAFGSHGIC
jgi:hypothetical protein